MSVLNKLIPRSMRHAVGGFSQGLFGSSFGIGPDKRRSEKHAGGAISRAVADAKRAGVHPLFALGAAGAYSPSLGVGDSGWSGAGSVMGRVLTGLDSAKQADKVANGPDPLEQAQIQALHSASDRDDAAAEASRTQTILQLLKQNGQPTAATGSLGDFRMVPNAVTSSRPGDPSVGAGPAGPGFKEVVGPFGEKWRLVDQQIGDDDFTPSIMGLEQLYKQAIYDPIGNTAGKWLGDTIWKTQQLIEKLRKAQSDSIAAFKQQHRR